MNEPLRIDASYGEGGGQVIRTSLSLSAITGRPIELANIRGGRSKPGLQAQHVVSVNAAAAICRAEVVGNHVNSQWLSFTPRKPVMAGDYRFEIGTAGSTSLVLQTILVPLILAGGSSSINVSGGTHNPMAPTVDYLDAVFLPALARMGVRSSLVVSRFGFFPRGGGEVTCSVEAELPLRPIVLEDRGGLVREHGRVSVSGISLDIAGRGKTRLESFIEAGKAQVFEKPSAGPGITAFLSCEFENGFAGFTGIGERGKRMEAVADEAGEPYRKWVASDATVDERLSDQLVLPAAFAKGQSRWKTSRVSLHLKTIAWLVPQFLACEIEFDDQTGAVRVNA